MATLLEWVNDKIRIPEDRKKEHERKFHLGPPTFDQQVVEDFSDWARTKPKEWWQSYDDMENPNMSRGKDALRFLANTGQDLAQFYKNLAVDSAQSIGSHFANIDFYNPFGKEQYEKDAMNYNPASDSYTFIPGIDFPDLLTPHARYTLDALQSDKTGFPTLIKDNPYSIEDAHLMKKVEDTAAAEANQWWDGVIKREDKDGDGYHDSIAEKVANDMPEYSEWVWDNQDDQDMQPGDYGRLFTDRYNEAMSDKYDEPWNDVFKKSAKSQMFTKYGIKSENFINPKGGLSGFDDFFRGEWGSEGKPWLKYESPKPQFLYDIQAAAELPVDIISGGVAYKTLPKITSKIYKKAAKRNRKEGIFDTDIARDFVDRGYRR